MGLGRVQSSTIAHAWDCRAVTPYLSAVGEGLPQNALINPRVGSTATLTPFYTVFPSSVGITAILSLCGHTSFLYVGAIATDRIESVFRAGVRQYEGAFRRRLFLSHFR